MSHAPSKKQFDLLQKKLKEATADADTCRTLADRAQRRAAEAAQRSAVAQAKAQSERAEYLSRSVNDLDALLRTRNETIVQLGIRLAEYGDPATPKTIGETKA